MTGTPNPPPPLPQTIQIDELKRFARSLNTRINADDSVLCHRMRRNATWAVVYLWLCECARTNPKSQAKISPSEMKKAIPTLSAYQTYFFCHSMMYFGYFKRTEEVKWKTDFESKINFVFPELVEAAEQKLNVVLKSEQEQEPLP